VQAAGKARPDPLALERIRRRIEDPEDGRTGEEKEGSDSAPGRLLCSKHQKALAFVSVCYTRNQLTAFIPNFNSHLGM
jgi:hypothetical protein